MEGFIHQKNVDEYEYAATDVQSNVGSDVQSNVGSDFANDDGRLTAHDTELSGATERTELMNNHLRNQNKIFKKQQELYLGMQDFVNNMPKIKEQEQLEQEKKDREEQKTGAGEME